MAHDTTDVGFLATRIERLERRNRWYRSGALAGVGLALILLIGQSRPAASARPPRSAIEAERFMLVGRDGKTTAILGTVKGSHGLFLIDDNEETRAELILRPNGTPELNFYDERGLLVRGDERPPAVRENSPAPEQPPAPVPAAPKKPGDAKRGPAAKNAEKGAEKKDSPTVYITPFGKKYHREGCRFLSKNANPVALSEVMGRYEPCATCKPPAP
jgi:hypothetical protein